MLSLKRTAISLKEKSKLHFLTLRSIAEYMRKVPWFQETDSFKPSEGKSLLLGNAWAAPGSGKPSKKHGGGGALRQWLLFFRVDSSFSGGSFGHCYLSFLFLPWLGSLPAPEICSSSEGTDLTDLAHYSSSVRQRTSWIFGQTNLWVLCQHSWFNDHAPCPAMHKE